MNLNDPNLQAEEVKESVVEESVPEPTSEQSPKKGQDSGKDKTSKKNPEKKDRLNMNNKQMAKWAKKIKVQNLFNQDVDVENPTPLEMIGKGRQGAVFLVSEDACMKVFGNIEDCDREYYALCLGQKTNLLPIVYAKGANYIVMELIKGVSLREYLESEPLTKELSLKLIEMLVTFQKIGFERIDHHKRQIYLMPDGNLKVIDVARTVWRDRTYPYPRKLLNSLGVDYKEIFLNHVQEMAPELYQEWQHYMKMDDMARQIYRVVTNRKLPANEEIMNVSQPLLTTKDEKKHYEKLEGLVRKVYKEEWIKDLIVQNKDSEKIKTEIKKYMEKYGDKKKRNRNKKKK